MYTDWHYARLHDRQLRERELAERIAGRHRQAPAHGFSLRRRLARGLFALAVAAEKEETRRVVWERLETRGRL